MPDLRSQKQIAARILKCGVSRVWMDPSRGPDIAEAITSEDVRRLIRDDVIRSIQKSGISSYRSKRKKEQKKKGRQKGKGSRKGAKGTRLYAKGVWMKRIRSIRKLLRDLRAERRIDGKTYRDIYIKAGSGAFRNKAHVMNYLERNNLVAKENKS